MCEEQIPVKDKGSKKKVFTAFGDQNPIENQKNKIKSSSKIEGFRVLHGNESLAQKV